MTKILVIISLVCVCTAMPAYTLEMALVEGGTFRMGSEAGDSTPSRYIP
jgi:formylglycine-generating enzyme required for sulfatase activity